MFRPMFISSTQEMIWTYEQYLQSWHWKMVKYEFAQLVPKTCVLCGSTRNLNIHHKTYERIGAESPYDLVYLCESCHKKLHVYLNYQQKYLKRQFQRQQRCYVRNQRY